MFIMKMLELFVVSMTAEMSSNITRIIEQSRYSNISQHSFSLCAILSLIMLSHQVMVHLLMVVGHHGLAHHALRHVVVV